MRAFTYLEELAAVSLGFKSLQNDFFYVNQATIESFGIEARFLQPILIFRDLVGESYFQDPKGHVWLFLCREKESDLRATGALRYIQAMSGRLAAQKKQSGDKKTIREVLEAQGGGLWYAPKAKPKFARIWLRKAYNTTFAPFIFKTPHIVDQRCNCIEPLPGHSWELVGAVLTSTIFAYSLEINGSASMGAGALEAPTSKLKRYPVFDPRTLTEKEKKTLAKMARAVWQNDKSMDWGTDRNTPTNHLRALDEFLLKKSGSKLKVEALYNDLRDACRARIGVAKDKVRTQKKQRTSSVGNVAKGIAEHFARTINARQFPENFCHSSDATFPVHIDRRLLRSIEITPLLDQADVLAIGEGGKVLLKGSYSLSVGEAIVRSILLNRESFNVPENRQAAEVAVSKFLKWFDEIRSKLNQEINESALGTGYEESLRIEIYKRLGVHPLVGERVLPRQIAFL